MTLEYEYSKNVFIDKKSLLSCKYLFLQDWSRNG